MWRREGDRWSLRGCAGMRGLEILLLRVCPIYVTMTQPSRRRQIAHCFRRLDCTKYRGQVSGCRNGISVHQFWKTVVSRTQRDEGVESHLWVGLAVPNILIAAPLLLLLEPAPALVVPCDLATIPAIFSGYDTAPVFFGLKNSFSHT